MRRSYLEALSHTRGRVVFGKTLAEHPLMRRQLVDLLIEVEGCAALAFETTAVLERVDRFNADEDRRLLRILTPLCKYCSSCATSTSPPATTCRTSPASLLTGPGVCATPLTRAGRAYGTINNSHIAGRASQR
jgi:hypothetical protein